MKVKEIKKNNKILALIMPKGIEKEGTSFFTDKENAFQLGFLKYEKGSKIKPHIHKVFERVIRGTQELFYVVKGRVRVDFYDKKGKKIKISILKTGDTLLIISAGHGFKMLSNSKVLVIKQGPYHSIEEDKKYFL